jgi:hypothetical protein
MGWLRPDNSAGWVMNSKRRARCLEIRGSGLASTRTGELPDALVLAFDENFENMLTGDTDVT